MNWEMRCGIGNVGKGKIRKHGKGTKLKITSGVGRGRRGGGEHYEKSPKPEIPIIQKSVGRGGRRSLSLNTKKGAGEE